MRFFLFAPYDFGASLKIIKNGVIFSPQFPFNADKCHLLMAGCTEQMWVTVGDQKIWGGMEIMGIIRKSPQPTYPA